MKKHLLSFALLLAGITAVFAAETVQIGDLYYSIGTSAATVIADQSGSKTNYAGLKHADIPASVTYGGKTYPVTSVAKEAFYFSPIEQLSVPASITFMGYNAFGACSSLTEVYWNAENCPFDGGYNVAPFYHFSIAPAVQTFTFGPAVKAIPAYLCYQMKQLTEIKIPASVTSIGTAAFSGCSGLKEVALPEGLTTMGTLVFNYCTSLEKVTYPSTMTYINDNTFTQCEKLAEFTIPESVKEIGAYAFSATALKEITIPAGVTRMYNIPFQSCNSLEKVVWNAVSCTTSDSYNYAPFYKLNGSPVKSFTFGDNVQYIPSYLCYQMALLTEMKIPATVTNIGQAAFSGCSGLTEVVLPEGLVKMGTYVFNNCTNLEKVNIPSTMTYINDGTFSYCEKLAEFTIPESITEIGAYAFNNTALKEITIPAGVTRMYDVPFQSCKSLEKVVWNAVSCTTSEAYNYAPFYLYNGSNVKSFTFGDNVQYIPWNLCYEMALLTEIKIPATVTNIGKCAFKGCSGLKEVMLPEGLVKMGTYVFNNCTNLEKVNIPSTMTYINDGTFSYCEKLAEFTIPESIQEIGAYAFNNTALKEITIPAGVTRMYDVPFQNCKSLEKVVWNAVSCTTSEAYNYAPFYLYNGSNVKSFTFGDNVQYIPWNLCYEMSLLTEIKIPATVTNIGKCAFNGCSGLKEVMLPEGLTKMGTYVFNNCTNLEKVNIPSTMTYINDGTFCYCKKLAEFTIHEGIEEIGAYAFDNTALKEITIPAGVTKLYDAPFYDCKSLDSIAWKAVNSTCSSATNTWPFYGCSAVRTISFDSKVEKIPNMLCYELKTLEKVYNYALTPQVINANVFKYVDKEKCELWIPKVSFELYKAADVWKEFFNIKEVQLPPVYSEFSETACDKYVWDGDTYSATQDVVKTYQAVAGNDSIVTLHLTINHSNSGEESQTATGIYEWHGTTYTKSGDYQYTLTNVAGCDSVATLHLTINAITSEFFETACDSYTWDGDVYKASGDYVKSYKTTLGSDSIVTLHLTINHSNSGEESQTATGSYEWHGTTYTKSGDYQYTLTNVAGCDSVATLHLTINAITFEFSETACDSYTWDGDVYKASGDYVKNYKTTLGSDSIVTLHLTINLSTTGEESQTEVKSYEWHGTTYTQSGDYQYTLTNVAGCDSVATLHLTIIPVWKVTLVQPEHGTILTLEDIALDEVPDGDVIHFVATPDEGWLFEAWQGCNEDGSLVVKENVTVTCSLIQDTSDVENVGADSSAASRTKKVIRDGQVLILRDGKTYNILGAEIK